MLDYAKAGLILTEEHDRPVANQSIILTSEKDGSGLLDLDAAHDAGVYIPCAYDDLHQSTIEIKTNSDGTAWFHWVHPRRRQGWESSELAGSS